MTSRVRLNIFSLATKQMAFKNERERNVCNKSKPPMVSHHELLDHFVKRVYASPISVAAIWKSKNFAFNFRYGYINLFRYFGWMVQRPLSCVCYAVDICCCCLCRCRYCHGYIFAAGTSADAYSLFVTCIRITSDVDVICTDVRAISCEDSLPLFEME